MARILLIDDEPTIRTMLRVVLEEAGFEVIEAGNGVEGVLAFRKQPADLVFCDLIMPDQDGLETMGQLYEESPEVKIIAMTGGGLCRKINLLPLARAIGAVADFHKPFNLFEVLEMAKRVLGPETKPGALAT